MVQFPLMKSHLRPFWKLSFTFYFYIIFNSWSCSIIPKKDQKTLSDIALHWSITLLFPIMLFLLLCKIMFPGPVGTLVIVDLSYLISVDLDWSWLNWLDMGLYRLIWVNTVWYGLMRVGIFQYSFLYFDPIRSTKHLRY